MSIPYLTIFKAVGANLNATPNQYGDAAPSSTDEAYEDMAIVDAILNAEAFIIHRIGEAKYNGHRGSQFVVDVVLDSGDLIADHIGPVIGVLIDGLPGVACPASTVARLRQGFNPLGLKFANALYGLEDNRIFFTSSDPAGKATVRIFQFTRPAPADATAFFALGDSDMPGEYVQTWIDMATGYVMSREGEDVRSANMYRQWAGAISGQEFDRENRLKAVSLDSQQVGE